MVAILVVETAAKTSPRIEESIDRLAKNPEAESDLVEAFSPVDFVEASADDDLEPTADLFHGFPVDSRHDDGSTTVLCEVKVPVPMTMKVIDNEGRTQVMEQTIHGIRTRAVRIPAGTTDVLAFLASRNDEG